MVPGLCTKPLMSVLKARYSESERRLLLDIARASIQHGASSGRLLDVNPKRYPITLQEHRASFVTLHKQGELRGCIGTLEPYQPLVCDVAEQAYQAAFADPRFPPVVALEIDYLELHIAVLTPPEPLHFTCEDDILNQLQPGIDGLIVEAGRQRGTFLPSVWESLPEPEDFWRQLKQKAHLAPDYWSDKLRVWRYQTEELT